MEKLLAIYDNQKKIGTCDECGAKLRYEYVTDKGCYGSECIHKHTHTPDWVKLNGKKDSEYFAVKSLRFNKLYGFLSSQKRVYYYEYRDGSGMFQHQTGKIDVEIAPEILAKMLANGYSKTFEQDLGYRKLYRIEK